MLFKVLSCYVSTDVAGKEKELPSAITEYDSCKAKEKKGRTLVDHKARAAGAYTVYNIQGHCVDEGCFTQSIRLNVCR